VQIFDILSTKEQERMDLIRRCHKFRLWVVLVATFGAKRPHVLQSYSRICFVDGIQQSFIANILLGDQGNSFSCKVVIMRDGVSCEKRTLLYVDQPKSQSERGVKWSHYCCIFYNKIIACPIRLHYHSRPQFYIIEHT